MAKKSSRNQRKNQRQRAGRAKDHGLPAKQLEERRAKAAARDTAKRRARDDDEDDDRDERTSDADDDAPRAKKAAIPPISQNMIYIGAGIIVVLAVVAYMASRNSAQPQRAAPEPGPETPAVTLQVAPSPPGSGRTLEPPIMLDEPPGETEEEKEAPPEKEKEEEKEKEKEKPTGAAPKPPPKLGEPPKAPLPKPTAPGPAAPKPAAPKPAAPKPTGDNPY